MTGGALIAGGDIFAGLAPDAGAERFDELFAAPGVKIERVVSLGQATPPGEWLDQDLVEFVLLLSGAAGLRFEAESAARTLGPGDWLTIPARARHRVEWTDAAAPTVWLAAHVGG